MGNTTRNKHVWFISKVKFSQTPSVVHLRLAATQRDWENIHPLSSKASSPLPARFLIPPKCHLCSPTLCMAAQEQSSLQSCFTREDTFSPAFPRPGGSLSLHKDGWLQLAGWQRSPSFWDAALRTRGRASGAALSSSHPTGTAVAVRGGYGLEWLVLWAVLMNYTSKHGLRTLFFFFTRAAALWHLFYKPR